MTPIVRRNHERNGIEVVFPSKPEREIIDGLKALGFRWSRPGALWWARHTAELEDAVTRLVLQVGVPVSDDSREVAAMIQAQEDARFDDFAQRCL